MSSILRTMNRYLRFIAGKPRPAFVSYNVTYRCNLNCTFCTAVSPSYGELDERKARKVIDELADFGIPFLNFSGGEPLLRRDLPSLAKRAKELGMITSINTNGTLTENLAKVAKWVDFVTVSLEGPKEIHDMIRGKGTFERAMKSLELLRENGVRAGVNIVLLPENAPLIEGFLGWLKGRVDYVTVQPVHPPRKIEGIEGLIAHLLNLKKEDPKFLPLPNFYLLNIPKFLEGRFEKVCDAGRLYISVSPKGEVLACGARNDLILGNLLEERLEELLSPIRVESVVERCRGCWLECTVGVSLAFRRPEPFTYLKLLTNRPS